MKRRVVRIFLIALAVWPLCHYGLARACDTNPWKLFGWGMYSVPGPRKSVRVLGVLPDGRMQLLDVRNAPEEQRMVDRFRSRRSELGRLASGRRLARGILGANLEYDAVVVAVLNARLDRETARLEALPEFTKHFRDGRSEPFTPPEEAPEGFGIRRPGR